MRYWLGGLTGAAALFASMPANAEDGKLDVSFMLRARVESIGGQFRPKTAAEDTALMLHADLSAEYDAGPIVIGGEVIDARSYFERTHSSVNTNDINALEPVQAYIRSDFSDAATITAGRFTMDVGSRRFIGRSLFRNDVNSFTGARLDLKDKAGDGLLLFWTMPQTRLPGDEEGLQHNRVQLDNERIGLQFFGASATSRKFGGGATVELYLYRIAEHDAPGYATRDRRLWTPGIRVYLPPQDGKTDFEVEAAWEGGTARATASASDITDLPVSAWFAHAHVGHSFDAPWSPRIALQFDIASGEGRGHTYTRFDPLFGARVFEFGPSSLFGPILRSNIVSVETRVEVKPGKRWDSYLAVRPLWLYSSTDSFGGTGVTDPAGRSGKYAGTQVDIRVRYWIVPDRLRFNIGYANLFKGDFLTQAPDAPATGDTHYGYGEIVLTL